MKNFARILIGCVICLFGVLAGMQFANGNIGIGLVNILLTVPSFIRLTMDFDN